MTITGREATQSVPPRCLCLAADIESYGRLDTPTQSAVQADLVRLLVEAAELSGLDRVAWACQTQGDQEFAVLPSDTPEEMVLTDFVRHLTACLRRRNARDMTESSVRLRLAVDSGIASPAALGFAGPAPVAVARFLNAPQLKNALSALRGADLAMVVSDRLFQDVVRSRARGLDPDLYARVHVNRKEFRGYGWLHVPGHSADQVAAVARTDEPVSPGSAASMSTVYDHSQNVRDGVAFKGDVTGDVNFGPSAGRVTQARDGL
ncbi:hypothetical protein G6541_08395 [Streptomyces albidoflavus]|nr:hypothetical protein [Streptomyces albidoflavus]